jgi:hypothetical protein
MALATAPLFSQFSRRGFVIVVPFGAILLILAQLIESDGDEPFAQMRASLGNVCAWPVLFFIGWAGLSLIWTPFVAEASIRYANLVALSLMLFATIQSLNGHIRTTNLNLLPIGLAASLVLALFVIWQNYIRDEIPTENMTLERLPVVSSVLMIPITGWLLSRKKYVIWLALLLATGLTLVLLEAVTALTALALALIVYGLAMMRPALARGLTMAGTALLMLIAPLLPFLLRPLTKWVYGAGDVTLEMLRAWGRLVQKDPLRLLTGHGFDVSMRAKAAGFIEPTAPRGLLFEIWYELGFLGVFALSCIFVLTIRYTRQLAPSLAASFLASLVVCFVFAVAGQASMQAWWLTLIGLLMIHLVALAHGHYHTRRPVSMRPDPLTRPTL